MSLQIGLGLRLGPRSSLPPLPQGFAFLIDDSGNYLVDGNGDYLIAEIV